MRWGALELEVGQGPTRLPRQEAARGVSAWEQKVSLGSRALPETAVTGVAGHGNRWLIVSPHHGEMPCKHLFGMVDFHGDL